MEISLHKVKTKIDFYADMNKPSESGEHKEKPVSTLHLQNSKDTSVPYLFRVALAIGDIEIRDKLVSSAFNMFLYRYESENCPKHTNSNMIFLKFLCSKSMDAQRLLECDIKVSIQPLRFNIDQDALLFLIEYFTKMGNKDLNEFKRNLVPPLSPSQPTDFSETKRQADLEAEKAQANAPTNLTPQQIFIRNFIFSPDLLIKFDFSGKYDKRPDNKMDKITKLLMVAIQLSNTEIKLKRIYYKRGFLGAEKLIQALVRDWISDIQRNQVKNLIKGWGIFNSLIQFFEGFTYLFWYPIEQYKKDGRVLCGIQKGSAAFSTCTILATIELTNRMFQTTKNVAEFFYDLVTPHRANQNNGLFDALLPVGVANRNIRVRRQPNDIREGLTSAYYVMYEGINDTAQNLIQEINQSAEHKGIPGAIGGALRQLPSAALAPIVLTATASCNILSGIRNQLKPDEKKDDDQKWKMTTFNS
jgi:autophagy-related protein 2